jgi:L-ascorbate metabolism protein UlaG (beta-lactamase superfamily)
MRDRHRTLWGGCALRVPDAPLVYFAGDTGYAPFFTTVRERLGQPDVALLPIGAYEPRWFMEPFHMNPADAVRAHQEAGAKVSIATHHAFFPMADDGFDSAARHLADARAAAGVPPEDFRVLDVGETVVVGS